MELVTSAADALGFDCEVVVLSRNPAAFAQGEAAHLASHRCVRLLEGDVCTFAFPPGCFDYVAHFGSTGPKSFHDSDPRGFFDVIVNGTQRVLDFAAQSGATRFLLASTGAVYGTIPPFQGEGVRETFYGGPDPLTATSANAEAKRVAEFLAACAARANPMLAVSCARGFAFIGPYLPAQGGFAAYDFIQDALKGRAITIKGDGTPLRSYLYGSDLAVWLWTILLRAPAGIRAWNVGADEAISIADLARQVAQAAAKPIEVVVLGKLTPGAAPHSYVPSVQRAQAELNLTITVSLSEAICRTMAWACQTERQ